MLTAEQNKALAAKLVGTTSNVYRVAREEFGVDFGDEDWDRLVADAGIFKCESCDEWLGKDMEARGVEGMCEECIGANDG